MIDKFQNKYRIPSARLQNWDYGSNAAYFVTICTQNREHYFGDITEGKMILSEIGKIANAYWNEIPQHFPFIKLDAFIIMPNHVHGIIIIDKEEEGIDNEINSTDAINRVSTIDISTIDISSRDISKDISSRDISKDISPIDISKDESSQEFPNNGNGKNIGGITGNKNPMIHNNLSRIIRWYKGRVAFESRKINPNFAWQSRFHDHIIRTDESYQRIQQYIINNATKWDQDKFNGNDN